MMKSLLSQIKILPSDQIYSFEWNEPKLNAEDLNINDINLIRHPFMVTALSDNTYLLLGQTGLYHALLASGIGHYPVQICHKENLCLLPQKLSLTNFSSIDLKRFAVKFPKQVLISDKEEHYLSGYTELYFSFKNEPSLWVYLRNSSRAGCPLPLEIIFRAILAKGFYVPYYESHYSNNTVFKTRCLNNIVSMPVFSLADLKTAALSERLFPPDILKVYSSTRVVNVDFPVSVLESDMPIDEKESFLRELIAYREQANRTVFLKGTVYILNI